MKQWKAIAIPFVLAACATPPEPIVKIETQRVEVPVNVPCKPNLPEVKAYPDTRETLATVPHPGAEDRLRANPADRTAQDEVGENLAYRVRLMAAGWGLRDTRIADLEAAIAACSK